MGASLYIVIEGDDPGFDTFVNGHALARNEDALERLAEQLQIAHLLDFFSADVNSMALLEEEGYKLPTRPDRLPPPQWFSADDGLVTVTALQECGVRCDVGADTIRVRSEIGKLTAADISTEEFPGFPTDMQAQYMALATQAEGTCVVTENIFENRFMHVSELTRMGANIRVDGRTATVRGRTPLSSAAVMASDLRASASLVLAALVAEGETIIDRVYHIDRGYERIEEKLRGVGAQIRRMGEVFGRKTAAEEVTVSA